jgi:hypothetical protein
LVFCACELFRQRARTKAIPAMIKVLLFITILFFEYGHFTISNDTSSLLYGKAGKFGPCGGRGSQFCRYFPMQGRRSISVRLTGFLLYISAPIFLTRIFYSCSAFAAAGAKPITRNKR